MNIDLTLNNENKVQQSIKLTPQILDSLEILQMDYMELESHLNNKVIENPFLEFKSNNSLCYNSDYIENITENKSLQSKLYSSISLIINNPEIKEIALILLDYLEDNGILSSDYKEIVELYNVNSDLLEDTINQLQDQLEPMGIFSKNVFDYIKKQLIQKDLFDNELNNFITLLFNLKIDKVIEHNKKDEYLNIIRQLNFYPINDYNKDINFIKPEAKINIVNNNLSITYNHLGELKFNNEYYSDVKKHTLNQEDLDFINSKYSEAKIITYALNKRHDTINLVLMEIIKKQKDFFLFGHDHLKAMKLDDIAKKLDINISTISRIAQKYILVNGSILQIKKLFSSNIDNMSNTVIHNEIKKIINNEKKLLSDIDIMNILIKNNIHISRRTVTKYREKLNIPNKKIRDYYYKLLKEYQW